MKNQSIKKINVAGKVGYVICILLIIASIASMVCLGIGVAGAAMVSDDKLSVTVSTGIDIDSETDFFGKVQRLIKIDGVENLSDLISDGGEVITPDDSDISEISVQKKDNGGLKVNATVGEKNYSIGKILAALCVSFCYFAAITAALYMLKALMKALKDCDTPFAENVVRSMTRFAYSLIPVCVIHMLNGGFWSAVGSNSSFNMTVDLGSILLVAVVFILVVVFRYGAQLQKESDETL
jgi:hypothetical protein